jgi:hypothetical protein
MPNLEELINIQRLYPNSDNKLKTIDIDELQEFLNDGFEEGMIKKAFTDTSIAEEMIPFFTQRIPVDVVLMFVDIVSFSKKKYLEDSSLLATYLDSYYDAVIPIIHSYGGVVEKIMGDGIICVFGLPFLKNTMNDLLIKAEECSYNILTTLKNTIYESKIAIHSGNIRYYRNRTNYKEYTMIGTPITELFRLESVSENNAINYYPNSDFDLFMSKNILPIITTVFSKPFSIKNGNIVKIDWLIYPNKSVSLQGVNQNQIKYAYPT